MSQVLRCDAPGCGREDDVATWSLTPSTSRQSPLRHVDVCPEHRTALVSLYDAGRNAPVLGVPLRTPTKTVE